MLGQFQAKPKTYPHGAQPPLSTCQASCPETHHSKLLSSATGAVFAFLPSNLKTLGHCCSKTVVAHTKSPQPHHVAAVGGALGLVWGPDGLDGPVTFFFSMQALAANNLIFTLCQLAPWRRGRRPARLVGPSKCKNRNCESALRQKCETPTG